MACDSEGICDILKKRTEKIHQQSSRLITLYSVMVFSDKRLYRQLVKDNYFVFKALEEQWEIYRPYVPQLQLAYEPALLRTGACERDLEYYYGPDWKSIGLKPSPVVKNYVERIQKLFSSNPLMLISHIYSSYLAVLAGGQILRGWAIRSLHLPKSQGTAFFDFPVDKVHQLLKDYRKKLNAVQIPSEMLEDLAYEAIEVFQVNNKIITNINGYHRILLRWGTYFLIFLVIILIMYFGIGKFWEISPYTTTRSII